MRFENRDEFRRERNGSLALAFRLSEDETATNALRTDPRVFCAVGRTRLRATEVTRLRAFRRALRPVLMALTALRARRLVQPFPALVRIVAAVGWRGTRRTKLWKSERKEQHKIFASKFGRLAEIPYGLLLRQELRMMLWKSVRGPRDRRNQILVTLIQNSDFSLPLCHL